MARHDHLWHLPERDLSRAQLLCDANGRGVAGLHHRLDDAVDGGLCRLGSVPGQAATVRHHRSGTGHCRRRADHVGKVGKRRGPLRRRALHHCRDRPDGGHPVDAVHVVGGQPDDGGRIADVCGRGRAGHGLGPDGNDSGGCDAGTDRRLYLHHTGAGPLGHMDMVRFGGSDRGDQSRHLPLSQPILWGGHCRPVAGRAAGHPRRDRGGDHRGRHPSGAIVTGRKNLTERPLRRTAPCISYGSSF
mmetsp:Transcript_6976/g.11201  ORF Transcript_6976/g.11201 Transcript_6976/m.11201 type:complete len:245 (+) Transcript_6976:207-941(+)